jgi:hypothetical protein
MNYNKTKTVFFRLTICLITLTTLESCSIFGIDKIKISQSEFTHNDNDILFQGKLYSINIKDDENIIFPTRSKVPAPVTMDRPNEKKSESYRTVEYQPMILFLTKDRFVLNMGCTIYGRLSKDNDNSYDVVNIENSNDCQKKEFNEIETLVIDALKTSNKCSIEKETIYFKRDEKVLMVYTPVLADI